MLHRRAGGRAELPAVRRRRERTPGCGWAARWASWRCTAATSSTFVVSEPIVELRPLGRAADRRVDRQAGQGHPAGGRRAARRARGLRRRPRVRRTCATRTSRTPSWTRRSRRSREAGHPTVTLAVARRRRPRPDLLLRRVRDRGGRLGARASTRSTSRTSRRRRTTPAQGARQAASCRSEDPATRSRTCSPRPRRRTTSRSWATSTPSEEFDAAVAELRTALRDAHEVRRRRSATGRASCTRPASTTRAARRPACSSSSCHDGDEDVEIPDAGYTFGT